MFRSVPPVLLVILIATFSQPDLYAATPEDAPASLTGIVVDPERRPAAQAQVLLVQSSAVAARASTGADGRFRIERLAPGTYELHVALEGFRGDVATVSLRAGEARDVEVGLRVSPVSDSVVVTAAHVDVPLTRVPGSMTVIAEEELKARQIETVADALRFVPGMIVARSGGRGALTSVFPRGGESDYTLVLIDGVRMNAFGGSYDFAHLTAADIERVEIARGPQSALFGSDAVGGAVQIVTRHGGRPRIDGSAEGGGFGTRRATIAAAGASGPFAWGATAEAVGTDGFRGIAPASGERVTNDDYTRAVGSLSGSWRNDRAEVRGDVRVDRGERGFPGPFGSNPRGFFTAVDRVSRGTTDTRVVSLSAARTIRTRARIKGQFSDTDADGEFKSPFSPDPSISETRRRTARALVDFNLAATLGMSVGLEALRERARSTFIVDAAGALLPIKRRVVGYFGEARYAPRESVSLSGGARIEHIQRDRLAPDRQRSAFETETVLSANPKVAAAWMLPGATASRWARLRAGAGTGIRPPDAFEISSTDNPALKPERSRSFEAAVEHGTAGGALVLEATTFWNRYDDLIVTIGRDFQDASRYESDNIANARARGVELAAAMRMRAGLRLRAAYTFLDTAVLALDRAPGIAPTPFRPGDRLLRRPRHQGSLDVLFTRGRVTMFGALNARGRTLDVEPNFGAVFGGLFDAAGYGVVDVGANAHVLQRTAVLEVFGRVSNVFDRRYEETLGYPALGRAGMIGVRIVARR